MYFSLITIEFLGNVTEIYEDIFSGTGFNRINSVQDM